MGGPASGSGLRRFHMSEDGCYKIKGYIASGIGYSGLHFRSIKHDYPIIVFMNDNGSA